MLSKRIVILFLFFLNCSLFGQNTENYENINWRIFHQLNFSDYVDINSEEWKTMPLSEKRELRQIPASELKTMTTKELIKAYLICANTRSFFLFSDIDEYYQQLYKGFNGVDELINRPDVVNEIIQYYIKMDPHNQTFNSAGIEMSFQIQFLEYLIGNPKLISKYNSKELHLLISELVRKFQIKSKVDADRIEVLESNIYAISRLLSRNETRKQNELSLIKDISILQRTGRIPNAKIASKIILLTNDFIAN